MKAITLINIIVARIEWIRVLFLLVFLMSINQRISSELLK